MSWKDRAQYILEKNNYIPVKQFKITQEKNRSYTAKTETASEADAHYENALRKQYGDWSAKKLRELIGKNEAEINTTQNLALAKGLERQNMVLRKLLPEREVLEERSKNVEKQQRYEASNEFKESEHYKNALRKQYGDFTPSQLREKIEANEREINNTKNSAVAKGYANQNTYLTRILNEAEKKKKEQEKNSYYELVNKPDFQEKSKEIKKQGFFGDSKYKYINNLDGYRDKADLRSLSGGGSNDYDRYAYLSNNEKDIYNYLFAVKGKKEANKFLETIEIDLDGRKQDAALKLSEKIADEHPVLSSIGTVAAAPARGIAGAASVVEDVINVATGNELNPYSDAHNVGAVTNSMRQTVSDKIAATGGKELPFIGNWKVFLYNAGMSAADSAIDILVTRGALSAAKVPAASKLAQKVTSNFVSGLMASDAAANAIVENKEKGYSDLKSLGLGIASGAVEMLTEKFSIDNIIKEPKTFLKSLGKSFAAEGSEEVASDILNTSIDVVFNGSNSEISGRINEYIKNGDGKKEAAVKAVADTLIPSFLAGGLSGMAMGTAYHGVNSARQNAAIADIGKEVRDVQDAVIDAGLKQPKNTEAYKNAKELSSQKTISNRALGKQAVLNSRAGFNQKDILKELGLGDTEAHAAEGVLAAADRLNARGETDSSAKAIRAVKNSVLHGIAKNAASIVGDRGDTKPLMKSNAEFISDKDNLITPEYIHDYAEFFTKSLEAISSPTSERLQDKTKDLTGELVRFATGKEVSPELAGDADFVAVSEPFQGKLNGAIRTSQALHNLIYGENAALDAQITQYLSGNKSVIENPVLPAQNSDYIAQTEHSDIKFSIDEDFEASYDKWVKNGRRNDISLTVGRTSEALKSIGVKNQTITWDTSKINKTLKKHKYLNDGILKQIPDILENPVIVMQSKQSDSRITMFGKVTDGDGLPIMAVLELLPTNSEGTVVLDEIKIVSTHSRKTGNNPSSNSQTQNLINSSEILYIDPNKNRTNNWMAHNRLQLPLGQLGYGSIKSITYPEGNVNSYFMQNGEKYVSESEENNERERGLLSNGIRGRQDGEGSQKRAEGVAERSGADKEGREDLRERRKFAQTLKAAGAVTLKTQNGVRAHFVDKSHYNSEMQQISYENAKLGVQTEFIIGGAAIPFTSGKRARGVFDRSTNTAIIQYDHARFSPEQINRHEQAHKDYRSNRVQKVKNIILNSLSVSKRNSIKQKLIRDYNGMIENSEDAVFEEFICNVLAGMNEYSVEFAELADAYWSGGELVDRYSPAEYTESMDSGGTMPQEIQYSAQSVYPSWVYDVLEGAELRKLESTLMDIRIGNDGRFVRTRNGEYIVQTDNKLIYTNGDYDNPEITKIIEFHDDYETNIDDARRMIYGAEKRGEARYREALQAIEDSFGKGFLYVRTDSTDAGFAGKGKGENSGENTQNRSKKSQRRERDKRVIEAARRGISFDDDGNPSVRFSLEDGSDYIFQNLETQEEYDKALKQLLERYGSVPKGENPSRDISVPKKIAKDRPVSQFARTMMEAGVTPDETVSEFERMILDGTMTHEIISNKSAEQRAKERVDYLGFDDAMKEWNALVDNGKVDKNGMALGMLLYNTCITNKDIKNAMKLAADLVSEASKAGQALQATRMLKMMTPDGQLYYVEKSVKKFNDELREKLGKRFQKDIEIDEELAKQFLEAKTEDERNEAYDALCQNIADQIPSTWRDRLDSWRYLSMLGNPRTHIRNIVGNAIFSPVVRIKNYIAAGLEAAVGVNRQDRTKSVFKSKGAKDFAKRDSISMQKELQGQNAKYAITDDINSKRTIYQSKAFSWLELLRKKNFDFLEKEDWWFLKSHYEDALARVITARKIQPEFLESGTKEANELLARIRNLAIKEAQAATYRDANAVAEAFSQIKHRTRNSSSGAARLAGDLLEGVMPFTKTPSNILKQGVLYSPVGLLQGIYKTCSDVKNNKRASTDALNSLARGLTGTGILLLGMLLKSMGLIRGREDDDAKKSAFDTLIGDQSYALVFGDKTYTIDWMAPLSLPLFIGVEIAGAAEKNEWGFGDVVDAVTKISDPMLELSVLQGLSSTVNSAKYSQNDALTAITANMVTSYLGQFFPTLGGQAARMIDNKRRLNYTDKESWVPGALQRFVNQTAAKIPFASKFLQVKVDNWGRELDYGGNVERIFENTISPGYYSEKNYTAVDKELEKLYDRTKENSVLPSTPQKSITQDKITYHLNAFQYTEFSKLRGQKAFENVQKTITGNRYKSAGDEGKVKLIKKCYEDAQKFAKEEMFKRGIVKKGA